MINSKRKGATAEREFARLLHTELGVKLERNLEQSRSGGCDLNVTPADPVGFYLATFSIEVKRRAKATQTLLKRWWTQTTNQAAKTGKIPLLVYRFDRSPWCVVVPTHVLNPGMPNTVSLEQTASLSVAGFCALIRCGAKFGRTSDSVAS